MKILKSLIIIGFCTTQLYAQSGTKNGQFDAGDAKTLSLYTDAGMSIIIKGRSNISTISYTYTFEGNEPAYKQLFEGFNPEFSNDGEKAEIDIEFPDVRLKEKKFIVDEIKLEIEVPQRMAAEIETKFSVISINNLDGFVDIENRSGNIKVENIGKYLDVENQYGNVVAINVTEDIDIESRSSTIDIKGAGGDVDIEANYSKLNISDVSGDVYVENKSGTLNIFDVDGDVDSESDYSNHEFTNITGDVDVECRSGTFSIDGANSLVFEGDYTSVVAINITGEDGVDIESRSANIELHDVAGPLTIQGQYLEIDIARIDGEINIENRSGKVIGKQLNGESLFIEGEYIKTDIRSFGGSNLEIFNRNADVDVNATGTLNTVNIESQYGNVTLKLPAPFAGSLDLTALYGNINTDFNVTTSKTEAKDKVTRILGKMVDGDGNMVIEVKSANIKILKGSR